MYSYVCDFNLKFAGAEAEDFLGRAARSWPQLWERIPGVTSTLLLSNAFALGGEYEYRFRVDIERPSTLASIDKALKSDDGEWRRIRQEWFQARSSVRGSLTARVSGEQDYLGRSDNLEALIHWVVPESNGADLKTSTESLRGIDGVVASEGHRPISAALQHETWARLSSLEALDSVVESRGEDSLAGARLFGELREVDGALFAGA